MDARCLAEPVFGVDKAREGGGGEAEGAENFLGMVEIGGCGADHGGAKDVGAQVGNFFGEGEAAGRRGWLEVGGGVGTAGIATMQVAVLVAGRGAGLAGVGRGHGRLLGEVRGDGWGKLKDWQSVIRASLESIIAQMF